MPTSDLRMKKKKTAPRAAVMNESASTRDFKYFEAEAMDVDFGAQ